LLAPLGALDKAALKAMVGGLQARGKTPLSASLMQAAEKLKGNEDGATVILVSDGIESCNADPCAIAAQLKKDDVKLVAHVIGFDIADPAAKQQLACIATSTGGVYLDAKDAAGLESALNKASQAAQGQKVKTEAPKKPKTDPLAGFNVQGVMRLSEDSDPLTGDGPAWKFYETGSDEEGKGALIAENAVTYNARLLAKINPGSYILVLEFGEVRKIMPVTVPDNEALKLDVSLDAGFVTSVAAVAGGGSDQADGLTWEVHKKASQAGEEGDRISTKYDPVPRFVLPAGDYVMKLIKDNAGTQKAFTLVAGDSINLDMSLDIGRLKAKALYAPGGPQVEKNLAFEVYKASNSIEGDSAQRLETKYDIEPSFGLPAGKYELRVKAGLATASLPVEVQSGKLISVDVVMNAGVLGWKGAASESIEIYDAKKSLEGERNRLETMYDDEGNLAMNTGDYLLSADLGDGVKKEYPFSIKPGERVEVLIAQ
jgi:Ca-activated chloride channel homolog